MPTRKAMVSCGRRVTHLWKSNASESARSIPLRRGAMSVASMASNTVSFTFQLGRRRLERLLMSLPVSHQDKAGSVVNDRVQIAGPRRACSQPANSFPRLPHIEDLVHA